MIDNTSVISIEYDISVQSIMKTRQNNDVFDHTGLLYTENET